MTSPAPATQAASAAITFPLHITEITDDGLRRIEAACRAERIRRAKRADPARFAAQRSDADDAVLETLPAGVLAAMAETMANTIPGGALA